MESEATTLLTEPLLLPHVEVVLVCEAVGLVLGPMLAFSFDDQSWNLTVSLVSFQKWFLNVPNSASFGLFSFFSHDKYSTHLTIMDKIIDGLLGIRTQGARMVGVGESTELWQRHASFQKCFKEAMV